MAIFKNLIISSVLATLAAAAPIQKRIAPNPNLHVALPLYSYPLAGVWDPTYNTIASNPSTTFDVIINPSSGPGSYPPESDYLSGVHKLQTYSNVNVYAYVRTGFTERSVSDVADDINTYKKWTTELNTPLAGFFVDEAPNTVGDGNSNVNYMKDVHSSIGSSFQTWTNPGSTVDAAFYDYADTVTAFETDYSTWVDPARTAIPWDLHSKTSVMIMRYDGAASGAADQAKVLIERGFKSGFVWGNEDYQEFSQAWATFSDSCAQHAGSYRV
ncbi:hypothetical protein B0A48_13581 [Cryoendolithus antarcticus]|uniref:Spherulation-specific family 4 n=1 Tax=Cryoendolithus antarcticus TaxID=1507870 RepID=A0A1V8SPB8_9PEZI|nr:hypothetical protein B0A48_13581 [Cryoendolithus antarcticus]